MIKILKATEPINIDAVTVLIYGQPGVGKTSLAFTADAPLLIDFDRGAHRSMLRKDTVQVSSWADIADISADDISEYKTIIIDTGGRCLDVIAAHIMQQDPKKRRSTGELTMQGFGALKAAFVSWLKRLILMNKDVVILAHAKEDKNKTDDVYVRPDFTGSSAGEVFKVCDMAGFLYAETGRRILDFNPSDTHLGKNCAGLPALSLPDLCIENDYLSKLIAKTKEALSSQSNAEKDNQRVLEEWICIIDTLSTCSDFDAALDKINYEAPSEHKQKIKALLNKRAKVLGFTYDKTAKGFADASIGNNA